ncbi:MAG: nucleotidyl transferase AbiEii/AbiGii toxin family protein, partial [Bifidobacteriaceae bacterium]|nr:nucleotidyl transferase AbiEii/AbiGii toxin family protein [Bifidobacteriaceae bacterium]
HTRTVRALEVRYTGLPASYGHVLVESESLEEICADKLKAFLTSRFLRYRDLWDLRWLATQPGFDTGKLPELFQHKIDDYAASAELEANISRLGELGDIAANPDFLAQLERFLPSATLDRTLRRPQWRELLVSQVRDLYQAVGL